MRTWNGFKHFRVVSNSWPCVCVGGGEAKFKVKVHASVVSIAKQLPTFRIYLILSAPVDMHSFSELRGLKCGFIVRLIRWCIYSCYCALCIINSAPILQRLFNASEGKKLRYLSHSLRGQRRNKKFPTAYHEYVCNASPEFIGWI